MENYSGMTIVEVFKTNVTDSSADVALDWLQSILPHARITFDLEDTDRILRIEAADVPVSSIVDGLNGMQIWAEVLPD
jgi:hypothetical protein